MKKRLFRFTALAIVLLVVMASIVYAENTVNGSTSTGMSCSGGCSMGGSAWTSASGSENDYPSVCTVQLSVRYLTPDGPLNSYTEVRPVVSGSLYQTSISDSWSAPNDVITVSGGHSVTGMSGASWSGSTFDY